jgi:hypothetical protein
VSSGVALSFLITFAGLLATGCDGDDIVSLSFGSLEVRTETMGAGADMNGYQVQITSPEFDATLPIGENDGVQISLVAPRSYTITLSDVDAGCSVDLNPQVVEVPANRTTTVVFVVDCG